MSNWIPHNLVTEQMVWMVQPFMKVGWGIMKAARYPTEIESLRLCQKIVTGYLHSGQSWTILKRLDAFSFGTFNDAVVRISSGGLASYGFPRSRQLKVRLFET